MQIPKERVKFFHIKREDAKTGQTAMMTAATEVTEDGHVRVGMAFCHSDLDRFSKQEGRKKALGRMRGEERSVFVHNFTGHSGDALIEAFEKYRIRLTRDKDGNKIHYMPHAWRQGQLVWVPDHGMTFIKKR